MMEARTIAGRIAYRDAQGRDTGYETFERLTLPGGHLLRAWCALRDAGLWREVSLAMDADWRPRDGFCRLWHADGRMTQMGFQVSDSAVQVSAAQDGIAQPLQIIPTPGRLPYLGLHPLMGDALIVHARGQGEPGQFLPVQAVTNAIDPDGDGHGPAQAMVIEAALIEPCDLTVAAGSFAAWHYRLRWRDDWPPADLWVRQGDGLFLSMHWSLTGASYELVALHDVSGTTFPKADPL
ncbi:hypothetical protein [Novosphingobium rosa]|uniref:hypothetical protein n=1 Tax=Novosphingobium rosa TaxID=76978 RepID=UPI000B24FF69|nr:hypothetical protein [Novosphingobium rosa]